ncbi:MULTISPECIES: ABC transporter permease [Dethiosulfovibrio]|uniref:ABC transporter permease n=2 Tax=Dethiosulfovibrio TaxID=47054 RepID=A0ABS9EQH1_9BACT|nr:MULTISPECIES: ABC transporter permease [Dethiosulfovibrio]MCF4114995.1 ABC transporter permease [Dethiosulfovibrio russensis]MCF4143437.1 ABC transporter permease [Dethiosulfovibrio marinus]MCF4145953.1 ABC transporter permease [Dethiosulfovibrio acidaminovorans]
MAEATKKGILTDLRKTEFFHNYIRSTSGMVGSILVISVLLIAVLGPLWTVQNPYDIATLELKNAYKPPMWLEGGSPDFPLGTDQQGRDMLSTIVYGSRVSLFIGLAGTALASVIGIFLGLVAGYFGGKVDNVIMRIADIQLSFPTMLIALFLMSVLGRGVVNILISLTLVGWVRYARTVRGETLSVKKNEYVEAAKVIGLPHRRILFRHIMPNVFASIIVLSTIQVGSFILTEASLSFLGLGVPLTRPSLGMLCNNGFSVLYSGLWWVSILPGLYIMVIVFGTNLLGDFLRDELNPKLK